MQSTINFGYLIFLSVVAALGGFLFGYDTAVISGTIAQVTQLFQLDALQQGWYVGCALVGSIIGVLFAGILSDKLGRKLTMVISAILFSASALGCALCTDFTQLVVYRIIGGVGIGVVSIVSPLYISEVSVAQYRGRLVSLYQLAVTVGFLGAYLVNYQLLAWSESGALLGVPLLNKIFITEVWRGMLGMETLPAILFFIIIFFIPESPRWLIVRGQERKAINILERIYNSITEATNQLKETQSVLTAETSSEWSLLMKPGILKAVIIGVCIANEDDAVGIFSMDASKSDKEKNAYIAEELTKRFPFKMVASVWRTETSITTFKLQSMIYTEGKAYYSKEYFMNILDYIGAGDAYCAGIIYSIINNFDPQKTVEFANAASCLKHTVSGDFNLVTVDEVMKLAFSASGNEVSR